VADGYVPAGLPKAADPSAGPVAFKLQRHDLDRRDPALILKGRVLDEQGRPVAEAIVEPFGFGRGIGAQFGGLQGFDPLALTNDQGTFRLRVPEKDLQVYVQVTGRFLAPRKFAKLAAGPAGHDLTLLAGATLRGRVLKQGKPLAGVAVGAAQRDRNAETFVGDFQAATDAQGVFQVRNAPSGEVLALYGLLGSLHGHGALPARQLKTGPSGREQDLGDLEVQPGYRLTGRVILTDGKRPPEGTRVLLSREEAWDTAQALADADGRFVFTDLPAEHYSLSANVRGYHVSARNASLDLINGFQLLGVVRADTENLRLLLEPGPQPQSRGQFTRGLLEEYNRRRDASLQGAR
jgi:Carboxypeptidase regulatory-like domain